MMGDMCGRYVVATPYRQMELDFQAVAGDEFAAGYAASYNVAPTDPVPVVWQRREDEGERLLGAARWGLIPYWAKDPGIGVRAFNARIESAAEKPMFRDSFAKRRCVLPADGYYEWKKEAGRKQPLFIHAENGRQLALAGLYERWIDPEGRPLFSVSVLTGPALGRFTEIHDRMPLTIARDTIDAWLDRDVRDADQVRSLLDLATVPAWAARPVGPEVGNVRNNGPELIRELTDPGTLF
jgi:putative SOS response-associated peptidase YedK